MSRVQTSSRRNQNELISSNHDGLSSCLFRESRNEINRDFYNIPAPMTAKTANTTPTNTVRPIPFRDAALP